MKKTTTSGHIAALLTILIWGTTFISTKLLLRDFTPIEILCIRFVLGYAGLLLIRPRMLKTKPGQEKFFILAGLCGVTLYFLFENIALTYTMASNVGVLVAVSPFFTALFSGFWFREGTLRPSFFVGFAVAMAGIVLISLNGRALSLNPKGDLLALAAAVTWAAYSVLTRKIGEFGYDVVRTTRRIFFYGLLLMVPALCALGFSPSVKALLQPENLFGLLYLGLGASAACFVSWSFAVGRLGTVRTAVYIYLVPVVTVITAALLLREPVTPLAAVGTLLILAGLALSEGLLARKKTPVKQ